MATYLEKEKARLKREKTRKAIELAMQNRWEEAVEVNREILELSPRDVEAYNRLGKALGELGRFAEAIKAYQETQKVDPYNAIAQKNLRRLSQLEASAHPLGEQPKATPDLFIEETGKTGVSHLINPAPVEVLARISPGDAVELKPKGQSLVVETTNGEYLGLVEPRLALRLLKLIERGNKYEAAIARVNDAGVKLIIREVYQHPSLEGYPSFPSRTPEHFRSYIKSTIIKHEEEEEDEEEEEEWEEQKHLAEDIPLVEEKAEEEPLAKEEGQG